jgi:hypothetical protein
MINSTGEPNGGSVSSSERIRASRRRRVLGRAAVVKYCDRTATCSGLAAGQSPYPVQFAVEYPDRPLSRLTSFFRIFVIIPISIVLGTVAGGTWEWTGGHSSMAYGGAGAGGLLFLAPLLMILFRQKYPRWWFEWNLELQRFVNRVWTYLALMNDRYPSTDDHQ